jgi:hypothetical protein
MTDPKLIDAIEDLLIAEKAALLSGDLADLSRLIARKERLVTQIENGTIASCDLTRLATLSEGNAVLLRAVMQAIKDTKALLIKGPASPETHAYSASGQRESLQAGTTTLAHKA